MDSDVIFIVLLILVTLSIAFDQVNSDLVGTPRDTEVKLNHSTFLNCSTDLQSVEVVWYHYRTGDPYRRYAVYDAGTIDTDYRQRFRIEGGRGEFNLIISSVEKEDSGKYECQDEDGIGRKASSHLIVLEDDPECLSDADEDGVVGTNGCGLTPDSVQLSCRVSFHGDVSPRLEWNVKRGTRSSTRNDSLCRSSGNEHRCVVTIEADDLQSNETSFVCETSRIPGTQSSCRSNPIRIMYAFGSDNIQMNSIGDEVRCIARTNQPCQYSWNLMENNEEVTVSKDSTLIPRKDGRYKCEAQCRLGTRVCAVVPLTVQVFSSIPPLGDSNSDHCTAIVIMASMLTAFGTAVITLLSLFIIKKGCRKERQIDVENKRRSKCSQQSNLTENEEILMPHIESSVLLKDKLHIQRLGIELEHERRDWNREKDELLKSINQLSRQNKEDKLCIERFKDELQRR